MSRFPPSGTEQLKFITKERHFGLRGGGGIPLLLARWAELYLSAFFPVVKKTSKMTPHHGGVELTIWEVYMRPRLERPRAFPPAACGWVYRRVDEVLGI
jgi:hypothetical protein